MESKESIAKTIKQLQSEETNKPIIRMEAAVVRGGELVESARSFYRKWRVSHSADHENMDDWQDGHLWIGLT